MDITKRHDVILHKINEAIRQTIAIQSETFGGENVVERTK